jgi:diguanylate cyclase (GGDEF)-like protein
MISIQQPHPGFGQPVLPERFGRKVTVTHAAAIAVIALMAFAAYLTLERAIVVQRAATTAITLTDRQRMLSQRIASLTAQYALGNIGVRHDLQATIGAFETTHWSLVTGDPKAGLPSAVRDPQLKAVYFEGGAPLDAAATEFVTRARRIASLAPQDPAFAANSAPLFSAAQAPLLDALDRALAIRHNEVNAQETMLRVVAAAICLLSLVALLGAALAVFRPMARRIIRLTREANELARQATLDPLTGLLNPRSFQDRGAIEIQKARRYQRPLSLLMIDADQLNMISSTHGPDSGATVLKALTSSFFEGTRISDLLARINEDQFAILLPETSCEGAEVLAERLRRKVSEIKLTIKDEFVSCTISIGVAAAEKNASFLWPTFQRADDALSEAKVRGRNRVVVAAAA